MTLLEHYKADDDCEVKYSRVEAKKDEDNVNVFASAVQKRDYQKQYFHIYSQRLEALREQVKQSVKEELGPKANIKKLSELDDIANSKGVVVIGTLFKTQILKPNILKEVSEDTNNDEDGENDSQKDDSDKFIHESDELVLEDELQRARLYFAPDQKKFKPEQFVTGIVCGVLGSMLPSTDPEGGGKFKVENIFLPAFPKQKPRQKIASRKIAFISGLEIASGNCEENLARIELASEWLTGEAGNVPDQESNSKIERLVIAGNSLSAETRDRNVLTTAKYKTSGQAARSVDAVKVFDRILHEFASGMDVDLMPGPNDPANQIMPQQPLHLCLFPNSSKYQTLKTVSNPYLFESCGLQFVGTSGQNLEDVMRNSCITDPMEALECLVRWSHVAPTCPDTLGCYPFSNGDPFVLKSLPHVFFVGNQDKFAEKKIKVGPKEVLLLSLPRFSQSSTLILLDLESMQCEPVTFKHGN